MSVFEDGHGPADEKQYLISCKAGTDISTKDPNIDVHMTSTVADLHAMGVMQVEYDCSKAASASKLQKICEKTTAQTVNIFKKMMAGQRELAQAKTSRYMLNTFNIF